MKAKTRAGKGGKHGHTPGPPTLAKTARMGHPVFAGAFGNAAADARAETRAEFLGSYIFL
jgi:hypothetical protein